MFLSKKSSRDTPVYGLIHALLRTKETLKGRFRRLVQSNAPNGNFKL